MPSMQLQGQRFHQVRGCQHGVGLACWNLGFMHIFEGEAPSLDAVLREPFWSSPLVTD